MIYCYQCPICEKTIDVEHPMSETDNPTEETIKKITCPGYGHCEFITEDEKELSCKIRFNRDYSTIAFLKFDSLSVDQKQQILKKRASDDFKKNIEEKKRTLQGRAIKEMKDIVSGK